MTAIPNADAMADLFGEAIFTYTREQAIEDGVLIDVSPTAREAGIMFPVALTAAVWSDCVAWTDADTKRKGVPNDEAGRLWDVVWMLRAAIKASHGRNDRSEMRCQIYRVPRDGPGRRPRLVTVKAVCGPADDGSPCITIMQPDED